MDTIVANPLQGTRAVRELNGLWTVVSDGEIVQAGCTRREAIEIEAVELAAQSPCAECGALTVEACDCLGVEWFGG